ncbi:uncharacterized protein LOC120200885 isoform X3 [Hibiscus syriacus]|uniref:uncharacterized protein LOC120200885 isoform X3 n=1 Tax=Hibiscus syriacus TaxID=106335 RepID=UPI001922BFED|nr:uncharacterized protein LOC120200885 isoform X3 [Hibiscus syriacus]
MHSFSLKFFTDLNSGATRSTCFPARLDHGLAIDLDFGRRKRVGSGCWDRDSAARKCWVVSCAVDGNGTGGNAGGGEIPSLDPNPTQNQRSFLSRSQTYATLKQQMEAAAKSEDYKEAARIRDSLKIFEEEEPVLRFRKLIKEAVAAERFEDAARYRDELKEIAPHSLLKCSSDATTLLLRRHWIITDGNEKTENVWGIGVIGEQPVILPKTGFEYSSACPLSTPSGRMEGDFEMKHIDRVGSPTFNVAIAPFSLSTLRDDANTF